MEWLGELSGSLYNELKRRGISTYQVRYSPCGWEMRLKRLGGCLRGMPVLRCSYGSQPAHIKVGEYTVLRRGPFAQWPIASDTPPSQIADRICETFSIGRVRSSKG